MLSAISSPVLLTVGLEEAFIEGLRGGLDRFKLGCKSAGGCALRDVTSHTAIYALEILLLNNKHGLSLLPQLLHR